MKRAIPASWDAARRSFWLLPALGVVLGVALGFCMTGIDAATHVTVPVLTFKELSSARTILQTLGTVSVSVGGVAFSVTVVSFQLASQQLSPRVLRTFQTDRLSQSLLASLLGLFVYSLIVLARLPAGNGRVPGISMTVAVAGGVLAFGLFAAFIHDIVISLQASTLIRRIAADGQRAVDADYPSIIGRAPEDAAAAEQEVERRRRQGRCVVVRASRAGFLQTVDGERLVAFAREHDALVEQQMPIGDLSVTGMALVKVWVRPGHEQADHEQAERELRSAFERELQSAFHFGDDRTVVQDVAFPVRQLADIALRALSPALNDPTTAENAMGSLADTLVVFVRHSRAVRIRCDSVGTPRFVALAPALDDLVRLGFDQVRRASASYPTMVRRLLTLLQHVDDIARENGIACEELLRQRRLLADALQAQSGDEDPQPSGSTP